MDDVMDTEDNSNEFSLNDFPDEILLKVMFHMNDTSLLTMTWTCHRFRTIAKEAFGRIYNRETYGNFDVKILCENDIDDQKRYRPFFRTFGDNMKSIEISFDDFRPVHINHWIYESMQEYCKYLTKLYINYGEGVDLTRILLQQPSLTHLYMYCNITLNGLWTMHSFPNLKIFIVNGERHLGRDLSEFFHKNRQLTEFSIEHNDKCDAFNIIDLLNGKLNDLKVLYLSTGLNSNIPNLKSSIVTLDKLESLTLNGKYASYVILGAISKGCKNITKLKMLSDSDEIKWNNAVLTLCSFKKLTKLKINAHNIGMLHLQRIIEDLPNLRSLHIDRLSYKSKTFESLPYILPSGTKLIKLKMTVFEQGDFICLSSEFIKDLAEFTHLNNGVKVMLRSFRDKLMFTQGEARRCNSIIYCNKHDGNNDGSSLNLLDLSDRCLEKIFGLVDAKSQCALYNSCTKMQNIAKEYLTSYVFYATSDIEENVFQTLGQHVSRISVENCISNKGLVLWRNINRYCSTITEMNITGYRMNTEMLVWPNVKKLIIKCATRINYQDLRSFVCPMLVYLEIHEIAVNAGAVQLIDNFDHGDAYRQLTTLKVIVACGCLVTPKILISLFHCFSFDATMMQLLNSCWDSTQPFASKCKYFRCSTFPIQNGKSRQIFVENKNAPIRN